MSLLKGYPQIDSRTNMPSIIFSEALPENQIIRDYTDAPQIKDAYTDLITYGMLYVTNFRQTIENALDNPNNSYSIDFFYGYTPNTKIVLTFKYLKNTGIFYFTFEAYDKDNVQKVYIPNRGLGEAGTKLFKEHIFTNKACHIYLCLTPYEDINKDSQCVLCYTWLTPTSLKWYYPDWYFNGSVFEQFQAPKPEETPDTPVGAPTGNNTDTEIGVPGLPTVSILDGLHHMYCPDSANVKKMGRALWSPNFFDNVVKVFANPAEAIVSLSLSPIKPTVSENPYNVVVGNIELQTTTGVEASNVVAPILTSQYGTYSFGDLPLYEKYSSYLDYNTTVQIYLPFIGVRDLSVNDVMGKVLSLTYNVDFFTGDFIALLKCTDPYGTLKSILYHWNGNILSHLPISSSDFSNGILSGLSTSMSIATGLAVGGPAGAVTAIGGSLGSLGGFKPSVDKGGSTSSNAGMLDSFNAYLIVTKPIEDKPKEYNNIKGGTVNKNIKLTQGLGYVVCGELHLENIGNATSEEKDEIERLLKGGVIL